MIDFTNCPVNRFRAYGGANGNKINITYQGHSYMLKFPPKPSRNRDMSYSNGCISEYVACHIFEMLGFRTQETLLGNYTDSRGKTKLVVACRDFTEGGKRLIEFAHLKNTCIDSEQNGYGKELSSILEAIEEQSIYPSDELWQFFWDMFIADAFLGNFDRHNGNWGFLVDEEKQQAELAPVYSPKWPDGKKHARNVYAHTREECEEKLKVLIAEMTVEIAEAQRLMDLGEGDGSPLEGKEGKRARKVEK